MEVGLFHFLRQLTLELADLFLSQGTSTMLTETGRLKVRVLISEKIQLLTGIFVMPVVIIFTKQVKGR